MISFFCELDLQIILGRCDSKKGQWSVNYLFHWFFFYFSPNVTLVWVMVAHVVVEAYTFRVVILTGIKQLFLVKNKFITHK